MSDITTVNCVCPPMPGMPCKITASGTLNPPASGLAPHNLVPMNKVPWKVLKSDGTTIVCLGEAPVDAALAWNLTCENSQVIAGQTYLVQVNPVWLVPVALHSEKAVTC